MLSDAWMPGASRVRAATDGGPLHGGSPRVVWMSLGADPRAVSAQSAAQRLNQLGRPGHLIWNPLSGEFAQMIPLIRAGCSLGRPEGLTHSGPADAAEAGTVPGSVDRSAAALATASLASVNAEGRLCVQIAVVAFACEPFTSGQLSGLEAVLGWLDSWGIARAWPAGAPAAYPNGLPGGGSCSRRVWARGGHFGASQVPGCAAAGPGALDIRRLTGRGALGSVIAAPTVADGNGGSARRRAELAELHPVFDHSGGWPSNGAQLPAPLTHIR
jgi:hypothetical protein